MRRLVAIAVGLTMAVTAGGCDAFGDGVAATVGGAEITTEAVHALVTDDAYLSRLGVAPGGSDDDRMDGPAARAVLDELIAVQLLEAEVAARAAVPDSTTQADTAGLSPAAADLVRRRAEATAALDAALKSGETADRTQDQVTRFIELRPDLAGQSEEVTCGYGVQARPEAAAGIEAALAGGATIEELAAQADNRTTAPLQSAAEPFCTSPSQLSDPAAEPLFTTPVGERTKFTVTTPQGDVTVFIQVTSRAQPTVEQAAQQVGQVIAEQGANAWLVLAGVTEPIEIDPRFGSWNPTERVVPPTPSTGFFLG